MTPEQIIEQAVAQMRATAELLRTHPTFAANDSKLSAELSESSTVLRACADNLEYVGIA